MLTLAAIKNLHSKLTDFVLAYPQADLDTKIFMELPQGFNAGLNSGKYVLRLKKNLCVLKQAGQNWFKKLSGALKNANIHPSKGDPCVFIGANVIVLVYFDDCLIFSRDKDKINDLIGKLKNKEKLDLTDEGSIDKYLGVEIERNPQDNSISLKQTFLIQRAIELTGLCNANNFDIPAVKSPLNKDDEGTKQTSVWDYRLIIVLLNYISGSLRPDIAYATHMAARFLADPKASQKKGGK